MKFVLNDIEGMDIKEAVTGVATTLLAPNTPLLQNEQTGSEKTEKTTQQRAIRKTFKGTTNLSKLLPTGSVLAFQMLSPFLTHQGQCPASGNKPATLALISLCSLSCFLVCFTDSYRDERGKVHYGLATFNGLWVIDGLVKVPPEEAANYSIKFIDILHALMSILVFGTVALFDKNVVQCFCPNPTDEIKQLLIKVPVAIGIVCSILFVAFPSKRYGIGSPLSRH